MMLSLIGSIWYIVTKLNYFLINILNGILIILIIRTSSYYLKFIYTNKTIPEDWIHIINKCALSINAKYLVQFTAVELVVDVYMLEMYTYFKVIFFKHQWEDCNIKLKITFIVKSPLSHLKNRFLVEVSFSMKHC